MLSRRSIEVELLTKGSDTIINQIIESKSYSIIFIDTFKNTSNEFVINRINATMLKTALLNLTKKEQSIIADSDFRLKAKKYNFYYKLEKTINDSYENDDTIVTNMKEKDFKNQIEAFKKDSFMLYNQNNSKDELINKLKEENFCYTYLDLINSNSNIFRDKETLLSALKQCDNISVLLLNINVWKIVIALNVLKDALLIVESKINLTKLACNKLNNYLILKYFTKAFKKNNYSFVLTKKNKHIKNDLKELIVNIKKDCFNYDNQKLNGYAFIFKPNLIYNDKSGTLLEVLKEFVKNNKTDKIIKIGDYPELINKISYNKEQCFLDIKKLLVENKILLEKNGEYYFFGNKV